MNRSQYFAAYHAARRETRCEAMRARYRERAEFTRRLHREVRRIVVTNTVRRLRAAFRTLGVQ